MIRKPTFTRTVTEKEWSLTILGLGLFFGVIVRLLPVFFVTFPINDGGMFAVMMRDLRQASFSLPLETTYNLLDIPYAYPPLAFYLGAFLQWLGIPELVLLQWVPGLFSVLSLPVFYFFAAELLNRRSYAATALIFFALAPGTYVWYLMGGGLTRGLGAIFLLLALTFTHRALEYFNWKWIVSAIVFCALTLLTHPQAALLAMTGCAILVANSFFKQPLERPRLLYSSMLIAAGALLFSAPWWGSVLAHHGADVFLSAGQSGDLKISFYALFMGLLSRQTLLPFATCFWLLGLGWCVVQRRFFLLAMVILPYIIDQRSSPIMPIFIYPLLAAYGVMNITPALPSFIREGTWQFERRDSFFSSPAFSMSMLGIIFYLFLECAFHATVIIKLEIPPDARAALTWVKTNIDADASFLILTARPDAMTDPLQEWFPAQTGLHSSTTLQGLEWTLHQKFQQHWADLGTVQACLSALCVIERSSKLELNFDHILLDRSKFSEQQFSELGFQSVFENASYIVMEKYP